MSTIYTVTGATVFWVVAVLFALCAAYVCIGLWVDRAHIRWPWQPRTNQQGDIDERP
jgi:hypothetical protein